MDELDLLYKSLDELKNRLREKKAEQQRYYNIANDIKTVYERLADDKKIVKDYKSSVKSLYKEHFDTFKGHLYSNTYRVELDELLDDYQKVINNLDKNMDALNNAMADYENKALKLNGPIGVIQASINSAVHSIQNLFN